MGVDYYPQALFYDTHVVSRFDGRVEARHPAMH